jgi:hypothetical protein
MKNYIEKTPGIVVVLVNIHKVPDNGRKKQPFFEGHFFIVFRIDEKLVHYIDSAEDKVLTMGCSLFDKCRQDDDTHQSCIFVSLHHSCPPQPPPPII